MTKETTKKIVLKMGMTISGIGEAVGEANARKECISHGAGANVSLTVTTHV